MGELAEDRVWEWRLDTNDVVVLRVDTKGVESVFVNQRLVSRSQPGGKPDGHTASLMSGVAPSTESYRAAGHSQEITVRYDIARDYVLHHGARLITPTRVPAIEVGVIEASSASSSGLRLPMLIVICVSILGTLVFGVWLKIYAARRAANGGDPADSTAALDQSLTCSNTTFITHYPSAFRTKMTSNPLNHDACSIEVAHKTRDSVVIFSSFPALRGNDAWASHDQFHRAFIGQVGATATVTETERRDGACLANAPDGAIVVSRLQVKATDKAAAADGTLRSCTFIRNGWAYRTTMSVGDTAREDEPALQRIIDGLELLDTPVPSRSGGSGE